MAVAHTLAEFFWRIQNVVVPTDDAFVTSVANYIRKCASGITGRSHMYIETAGGETRGLL